MYDDETDLGMQYQACELKREALSDFFPLQQCLLNKSLLPF